MVVGTSIGCVLAWAGGSLVESMLYEVGSHDAWILAGAILAMALCVGLASYLPARRATRVDPAALLGE